MAVIKLKRHHHLGAKKAKATVKELAKKLEKELDAQCQWHGSKLEFKRTGASGHIDVGEDAIEVEIKLGMVLRPLKGKIEKTINEEIDNYLKA